MRSARVACWCASPATSARRSTRRWAAARSGVSTSSSTRPPTGTRGRCRWRSELRVTILCPHLRIAGGVRAILTYADRLVARGHDVTLSVPAKGAWRAVWLNARGAGPDWMPGFRPLVTWVMRWDAGALPDADVLLATAWQSAPVVAAAAAAQDRDLHVAGRRHARNIRRHERPAGHARRSRALPPRRDAGDDVAAARADAAPRVRVEGRRGWPRGRPARPGARARPAARGL